MKRALLLVVVAMVACDSGLPGAPSGATDVYLNEIMPSNYRSCADENGKSPDWIELYNASSSDVSLEGYFLSDKTLPVDDSRKLGSVVVPAGGVLVLWADGEPELGPKHLAFKLNAGVERILLYGPDRTLLDRADWNEAETDVSIARFPDGAGAFVSCAAPSCKRLNGAACGL
jgi:hypothetical protein